MDWRARTRELVRKAGSWKPCICVQGGGAKGVWEGGLLTALLRAKPTASPVAIWGTSAGAINAVWASAVRESASDDVLLHSWLELSKRVRLLLCILVVFILGMLSMFCLCFWYYPRLTTVLMVLVLIVLIDGIVQPQYGLIKRLPGIIPVGFASRFFPCPPGAVQWHSYFCTADVGEDLLPTVWNMQDLNIFLAKPGDTDAEFLGEQPGSRYALAIAALSSAALPFLFRPLRIGSKLLQDGGLESNLPVDFIRSAGTLGGMCAICIVPSPLRALKQSDYIDYRVLRFLRDLQRSQVLHRSQIGHGASVVPPYTWVPILVVRPRRKLSSGLLRGFLCETFLRREFELGLEQGQSLVRALTAFESGDDDSLRDYVLDELDLSDVENDFPKPSRWTWWANTRWRGDI